NLIAASDGKSDPGRDRSSKNEAGALQSATCRQRPSSDFWPACGSGLLASGNRWCFALAARSPFGGDGDVVLHVVDSGHRPGNFPNVALEPLVRHAAGQRDAAALVFDVDLARARQQLERIVNEVLDFILAGRSHRLTAPDADSREQRGRGNT